MKRFIMVFIILVFANIYAQNRLTADEILNRVDENQTSSTAKSEAKMIIYYEGRELEKRMASLAVGAEKSFAEFTFPARDKGTKFLRIEDEMWMYMPSAEKIIKIAGHMLRQSMMGSDFSYEDALEQTELRKKYDAEITGEERVDDRECYILELTANTKKVTYYRRKIWVDKVRFVPLKAERYAKSGKLLKLFSVKKVEKIGDRYYPTHMVMEDKLRFNSRTEMIIESIEFDVDIPENTFSLRNLEKR